MGKKPKQQHAPFATDKAGKLFVMVRAMMSPMIPFFDGLPITTFKGDSNHYLDAHTAIRWAEKEAGGCVGAERTKYETMAATIRKALAQVAAENAELGLGEP